MQDITYEDVRAAAHRIRDAVVWTPLIENHELNDLTGGQIHLKLESLQRGGAFKFRGAYNRIAKLTAVERAAGVVAYSSGNHAIGVAIAARLLRAPATVVMPRDAPKVKIERVRAQDAEVVFYDRRHDSREQIATRIAVDRGAVIVPSFDDPDIIAGQATVGLEIASDLRAQNVTLGALLCPAGGGGLAAGCAIALSREMPRAEIFPVEPTDFDDLRRSLLLGRRVLNRSDSSSVCDALLIGSPGELTFPVLQRHARPSLVVSDAEVESAVAFAHETLRLVVEPSGAVALGAVLSRRLDVSGRVVALVLSGGNADFSTLQHSIGRALSASDPVRPAEW